MTHEKVTPEVFKKMQEHERSKLAGDLSKKILASLDKSYLGPQTLAWLKNMNDDLRVSGSQNTASDTTLTAVSITDKIFDEFQRYAFQYNQTEPDSTLLLHCQRPDPAALTDGNFVYSGFLYNSRWALMVRAELSMVTFHFVTPRLLYEKNEQRESANPILSLIGERNAGEFKWSINGHVIDAANLSTIAKKVFARLIRVTRKECSDSLPMELEFIGDWIPQSQAQEAEISTAPSRIDMLTDLIVTLLETLDEEIQEIEFIGIKAMRTQQTDASRALLDRSKGLRSIREKSAEIAVDWAGLLSTTMIAEK